MFKKRTFVSDNNYETDSTYLKRISSKYSTLYM